MKGNISFGYKFGVFFFRKSFQVQSDFSASACEWVRITLSAGTKTIEEAAPFRCISIPII